MVTTLIIVPELMVPIVIPPMFLMLFPLHARQPTTTATTGATIVSVPIVPLGQVLVPLSLTLPLLLPISMPMWLPLLPIPDPLSMMSISMAVLMFPITMSSTAVFVPVPLFVVVVVVSSF